MMELGSGNGNDRGGGVREMERNEAGIEEIEGKQKKNKGK